MAFLLMAFPSLPNLKIFLQVGSRTPEGQNLSHVHVLEKPIVINEIGSSIDFVNYVYKKPVSNWYEYPKTRDSVVLLTEGHQIEYLEDTRMFEVKQGPYPGFKNAKIYLKEKSHV
jgi:hypothetical protein